MINTGEWQLKNKQPPSADDRCIDTDDDNTIEATSDSIADSDEGSADPADDLILIIIKWTTLWRWYSATTA